MDSNVSIVLDATLSVIQQKEITTAHNFECLKISRENGLSGMFFPWLVKENQDPIILKQFQQDYYEYIKLDTLQQKAINEIHELFLLNEIEHIFLKGSYLKTIYPESYMRSMGDIDILVKPEKMKQIHQILEEANYVNWSNSKAHDCFHLNHKIFVEIHPSLNSEFDKKYNHLFKDVWSQVSFENNIYEMNLEDQLLYLIFHMVKHLSSSGFGLRNILDIYYFLRVHQEEIDCRKVLEVIEESSMKKFFQNIIFLVQRYFHLEGMEIYLLDYVVDEVFFENATRFIALSGVHGHGEENNIYLSATAKASLQKNSTFFGRMNYLLRLIFPSFSMMKGMYPLLKRHPYLYPFSWIYRWFDKLIRKHKVTKLKIKKLKMSQEEILYRKNLFEQFGL